MGKPIHSMWTGCGSPLASDVGVRPGPGQSEFSTPLATAIAQGQAHRLRETRICSGLFCPETKGRMLSSQCGSTHNHVESWASDNHGDFSNILCQKFFLPWLGYLNYWFKHLLRLVKDKDRAAPGPHGLRERWSGSAPVLTRNETASPGCLLAYSSPSRSVLHTTANTEPLNPFTEYSAPAEFRASTSAWHSRPPVGWTCLDHSPAHSLPPLWAPPCSHLLFLTFVLCRCVPTVRMHIPLVHQPNFYLPLKNLLSLM